MSGLYLDPIDSQKDIYDYLMAHVSTFVGKYNFTVNGVEQTQPAIYVVDNEDSEANEPEEVSGRPEEYIPTGIEILIYPPKIKGAPYLGASGINEIYLIKVIQHDLSKTLAAIKAALIVALPYFREKSHLPRDRQNKEELNMIHIQTYLG